MSAGAAAGGIAGGVSSSGGVRWNKTGPVLLWSPARMDNLASLLCILDA